MTDPNPVQVARFTPANPKAGEMRKALMSSNTGFPVTKPLQRLCKPVRLLDEGPSGRRALVVEQLRSGGIFLEGPRELDPSTRSVDQVKQIEDQQPSAQG